VSNAGHHQAVCAEIIRLLKTERERRKLSKYVVSKRSGVSQSMLSLVERGLRNPTLELTLRIADGIGVDLTDLIKKAQASISKKDREVSKGC
jgi:transcriptional regulator with XRE-family HTH domain